MKPKIASPQGRQVLTELLHPDWKVVEESVDETGKRRPTRLSGVFAEANKRNANKRYYKREIWAREVARISKDIAEGRVFMEADHPQEGSPSSTTRVTSILRKLWMEGDIVMGEEEVVETAAGKDIAAIARAGGRIGVSSRGCGSVTRETIEGIGECDVVGEDYQLFTFDHVVGPSVRAAEITQVIEQARQEEAEMLKDLTLEKLKAENQELYKALLKEAADQLAPEIEKKLGEKAEAAQKNVIQTVFTKVMEAVKGPEDEEKDDDEEEVTEQAAPESARVVELEKRLTEVTSKLALAEVDRHIANKLASHADKELLTERIKSAQPQTVAEVDICFEKEQKYLIDVRKSMGTPSGFGRPMLEGFNPENPRGDAPKPKTAFDSFTLMTRRSAGLPTE